MGGIGSAPLADTLDPVGVKLLLATVEGVDGAGRTVVTDHGDVRYERLVVALGSRVRPLPVPGAGHALDIDSYDAAAQLERRLHALDDDAACIAIVGAGFTGIELAAELRSRVAGHHPALAETLEIVLIDCADVVGRDLGANP